MSYYLRFWRDSGKGLINRDEADPVLGCRLHIERDDDAAELNAAYVYYNPDTEVYFRVELDGGPPVRSPSGVISTDADESGRITVTPPEEIGDEQSKEKIADAGMVFRMNLCRPSFFADEALEVIVDIARRLELLIEDPNAAVRTRPKKPDAAALRTSWLDANARVCAKLAEREGGGPMRWAPRELLDGWWGYMSARRDIQRATVEDGLFAPRVMLLARREKHEEKRPIERAVVWRASDPLLLPDTELVQLIGPDGGVGRLVGLDVVEDILGDRLQPVTELGKLKLKTRLRRWDGRDGDQIAQKVAAVAIGEQPSAFDEVDADAFYDARKG